MQSARAAMLSVEDATSPVGRVATADFDAATETLRRARERATELQRRLDDARFPP